MSEVSANFVMMYDLMQLMGWDSILLSLIIILIIFRIFKSLVH